MFYTYPGIIFHCIVIPVRIPMIMEIIAMTLYNCNIKKVFLWLLHSTHIVKQFTYPSSCCRVHICWLLHSHSLQLEEKPCLALSCLVMCVCNAAAAHDILLYDDDDVYQQ